MASDKRELTFLLAAPERRVLETMARRLPRWVTSDLLTGIGVAGAIGSGAAYAFSSRSVLWLLVASAALVVNWFGDSLDGTLARVRKTERPKYGYYLDHVVDAFSTTVVGVGLGLSPYLALEVALGLVVLFLVLAINVYLETAVFDAFRLGYGPFGPTEARVILVTWNLGVVGATAAGLDLTGALHTLMNGIGVLLGLGMAGIMLTRFVRNLRELAELEPVRR
jgi:phosphatidylglycerophosphate synthase